MRPMRIAESAIVGLFALSLLVWPATAAEKKPKLTCCQEAMAKKEECKHKCCITAHKAGKSCEKCNPNKEDLKKDKEPKGRK